MLILLHGTILLPILIFKKSVKHFHQGSWLDFLWRMQFTSASFHHKNQPWISRFWSVLLTKSDDLFIFCSVAIDRFGLFFQNFFPTVRHSRFVWHLNLETILAGIIAHNVWIYWNYFNHSLKEQHNHNKEEFTLPIFNQFDKGSSIILTLSTPPMRSIGVKIAKIKKNLKLLNWHLIISIGQINIQKLLKLLFN